MSESEFDLGPFCLPAESSNNHLTKSSDGHSPDQQRIRQNARITMFVEK